MYVQEIIDLDAYNIKYADGALPQAVMLLSMKLMCGIKQSYCYKRWYKVIIHGYEVASVFCCLLIFVVVRTVREFCITKSYV